LVSSSMSRSRTASCAELTRSATVERLDRLRHFGAFGSASGAGADPGISRSRPLAVGEFSDLVVTGGTFISAVIQRIFPRAQTAEPSSKSAPAGDATLGNEPIHAGRLPRGGICSQPAGLRLSRSRSRPGHALELRRPRLASPPERRSREPQTTPNLALKAILMPPPITFLNSDSALGG